MNKNVKIEGMSCGHCAAAVKEELEKLEGVRDVVVDVPGKCATFEASMAIPDSAIVSAVTEAGYKVVEIN